MQSKKDRQKQWLNKFLRPIYSPRSAYSHHLKQIDQLKINMTINIDKYILGNLKTQFEKRGKQMNIMEFIYFSKKFLKDWNLQLYGRQIKIHQCLINIWKQIDLQNTGKITWEQFNSKIIQTGLNLKCFSNNAGLQTPVFKQLPPPISQVKTENPITKMIYIQKSNKIAYFRDEAICIDFFSTEASQNNQSNQTKTLLLPQKQLKVQTMIKVKSKNTSNEKQKQTKVIKKQVKVSSYKNTVIDAIYVHGGKYNMLFVSCSDKFIRCYDVAGSVPILATQPQNQDELMIHQFPCEILNMAWDSLNQVLYATGKNMKIYQWVLKTDSQRQLYDEKGHTQMISTILMMPKLHLLATGGYDGKMILWDTVGQKIKCEYIQHTRAISSIIFHQTLIMLFTAAFDHKVCIWNPYISSLIHKIDSIFNVIALGVIPKTNYLLCLDSGGTVKIRQTGKFTQVSAFSIFRSENNQQGQNFAIQKQKQTNICVCVKNDGPIQYFFGAQKIIGYQYYQVQKNANQCGVPFNIKYRSNYFSMYTPIKNHILIWDLLTGINSQNIYDMTQNDISAFQLIEQLNIMILGDFDGSVFLRKVNDGVLISKLYKFKMAISHIQYYQIQRSIKQKHLKKTFILFCATQQGEIAVFKCNPKIPFQIYKIISFRKDYKIANGSNLSLFEYLNPKNILIATLSSNQILFIDVEKSSLMIKLQMGKHQIRSININSYNNTHFLVTVTKNGNLISHYLPPNSRKFKVSCRIVLHEIKNAQNALYSNQKQFYIISTQNSEIFCVPFKKYLLESIDTVDGESQLYSDELKIFWRMGFSQRVKKISFMQNDQILIILTVNGLFYFISTANGQQICQIKSQSQKKDVKNTLEPLLYLKQKTQQLYIPNEDKYFKVENHYIDQEAQYKKIIDPNYFIQFTKQKYTKNFNKKSNPQWFLNLNYGSHFQRKIQQVKQVKDKIRKCQKQFTQRDITSVQKKLSKAVQLQKKWEKQKQTQQEINKYGYQPVKKPIKEQKQEINKKQFKRGSSLGALWKYSGHKNSHSAHKAYQSTKLHKNQNDRERNLQYREYSTSMSSDPLFRLGQALKSLSKSDQKAQNFIQLAKKKDSVKFPKISKIKL